MFSMPCLLTNYVADIKPALISLVNNALKDPCADASVQPEPCDCNAAILTTPTVEVVAAGVAGIAAIAAATNAVEAAPVVLLPRVNVGTVTVPVNVGDANGAAPVTSAMVRTTAPERPATDVTPDPPVGAVATYASDAHAVAPSPIFDLPESVSTPISPFAKIVFSAVQSAAVPARRSA